MCLALYQVERFVLTSSSMTSLNFSWSPPIINGSHITEYSLTCKTLMDKIPTPDTLMFGPAASMATVTGLSPGVTYSCSITTFGPLGTSVSVKVNCTMPGITGRSSVSIDSAVTTADSSTMQSSSPLVSLTTSGHKLH